MKKTALPFLLFVVALLLSGCGGAARPYPIQPLKEKKAFTRPLHTELYADTGDEIFVYGLASKVEGLKMSTPIKSTMPGAYGIPFDFYMTAQGDRYLMLTMYAKQDFFQKMSQIDKEYAVDYDCSRGQVLNVLQ